MYKHHIMGYLREGENTIGFFSRKPPVNLIVFVHGFGGSALGTWKKFDSVIKEMEEFEYCDCIFYGYQSMNIQALGNADLFYKHLARFTEPRSLLFSHKRIITSGYSRIIIMAHSMGAIVVRRALLSAYADNIPWLDKCKMILFAPAHRGAYPQKLVFASLPSVLGVFGSIAQFAFPSLNDLHGDSPTIKDLISDTEAALKNGNAEFAIAKNILTDPADKVIYLGRFCNDPNNLPQEGKGHIGVCKPPADIRADPVKILCQNIVYV